MKRFFALFLLLAFATPFAFAQDKLLIEGESYLFDQKTQILTYKNPKATLGKDEAYAETLLYFKKENRLVFKGNVVLRSEQLLLTAERGEYDLTTKQFELLNATVFDKSNNAYLAAKRVVKSDEFSVELFEAQVTLCRPDDSVWQFDAHYTRYYLNNYAYSWSAALYFEDLPFFYSPFLAWPTKKGRASGFLAPNFTSVLGSDKSKAYGSRLEVPYFLALDQDHDLTITPNWFEKRGLGGAFEYRYAFIEGMYGEVDLFYIEENQARDLEYEKLGSLAESEVETKPSRLAFNYDHRQNIFFGGQFFFHQLQATDNEVTEEYLGEGDGTHYAFLRSASLVFPWGGGGATFSQGEGAQFVYGSTFDPTTNETTHLNTDFAATLDHRLLDLGGSGLNLSFGSAHTKYRRTYGWTGNNSSGSLGAEWPFSIDFLNIIPGFSRSVNQYDVRYNYSPTMSYDATFQANPDSYGWTLDEGSVEVNFELFRIFKNEQGQGTHKLSFTPRITFLEVEDVDQRLGLARLPNNHSLSTSNYSNDYNRFEDMFVGETYSQKNLTYRLESNLLSKNLQTGHVRSVLNASVTRILDLNRKDSAAEQAGSFKGPQIDESLRENDYGEMELPLRFEISFAPVERFSSRVFYRYDDSESKLLENQFSFGVSSQRGHSFSLDYRHNQKAYMELNGTNRAAEKTYGLTQNYYLSDALSLSLYTNFDLNRNQLSTLHAGDDTKLNRQLNEGRAQLIYKHQCFEYELSYQEKILIYARSGEAYEGLEQKVAFTMRLAGWPGGANPFAKEVRNR